MNKKDITVEMAKDTGLALTLVLLLILYFFGKSPLLVPAIGVLVLTMTFPAVFKLLAWGWFGFSHLLGRVVFKALLAVIFFVIVTPVGQVRKMFGEDSLHLRNYKNGHDSVFLQTNHLFSASDLEKPY